MLYLKANIVQRYEPRSNWGSARLYLEIGDDLYATRNVEIYENGNALRYDRNNWIDGAGTIGDMKYDAKKWLKAWGPDERISAYEFEAAWMLAGNAPNQPQAYSDKAGSWPMLI